MGNVYCQSPDQNDLYPNVSQNPNQNAYLLNRKKLRRCLRVSLVQDQYYLNQTFQTNMNKIQIIKINNASTQIQCANTSGLIRKQSILGKFLLEFNGNKKAINTIELSQDEKQLLSGGNDTIIRIWSTETGECERTLSGHKYSINDIAIDEDFIQSAGFDKNIIKWNLSNGHCELYENLHTGIMQLLLCKSIKSLFSSSFKNAQIFKMSIDTGNCILKITYDDATLYGYIHMSLSNDSETLQLSKLEKVYFQASKTGELINEIQTGLSSIRINDSLNLMLGIKQQQNDNQIVINTFESEIVKFQVSKCGIECIIVSFDFRIQIICDILGNFFIFNNEK